MTTGTEIVVREARGVEIRHRRSDGYIDAKAMCEAFGKRWDHYSENTKSRALFRAIAARLGVPVKLPGNPGSLIQTREGRTGSVFVHPQVAIHLAMWLDADFAAQVMAWVEELLTTGSVAVSPAPNPLRVYSERVLVAHFTRDEIPEGHWTVFHECGELLITAEQLFAAVGLEMDRYDLLDGSVGQMWVAHRKAQGRTGDRVLYVHHFPPGDARGDREAWAYPNAELFEFRLWLRSEYLRKHFPAYLERKYGRAKALAAVPALRGLGVKVAPENRLAALLSDS